MNTPPPILDPEAARSLWRWALQALEQPTGDAEMSRWQMASILLEVLAFSCCHLAHADDDAWIADVPRVLAAWRNWSTGHRAPQTACMDAIATLLAKGAPVDDTVREMVGTGTPAERAAVARGLRPSDPAARELLQAMLSDANVAVRRAVREKLPQVATQWWTGVFADDPLAGMPGCSDQTVDALRTLVRFAERPEHERPDLLPELATALPHVPSPLLAQFVHRLVRIDRPWPYLRVPMCELASRPDGEAQLWQLVQGWLRSAPHAFTVSLALRELLHPLPSTARAGLCRGWLAAFAEDRPGSDDEGLQIVATELLRIMWPADLDAAPLLDAWQSHVASGAEGGPVFDQVLSRGQVDLRPHVSRLIALCEEHDVGEGALGKALTQLDADARAAFIPRGLASPSADVRAVAMTCLVETTPDPESSTAAELFARCWSDARLGREILSNGTLTALFCPWLRGELVAGRLDLMDAARVIATIGSLWGGTDGAIDRELPDLEAWHAHAPRVGPPTEDEWHAWRQLQDEALTAGLPDRTAVWVLAVRPPGPIAGPDVEVLARVMQVWRGRWEAGDHQGARHLTLGLSLAWPRDPDPAMLPHLRELVARDYGEDEDGEVDLVGPFEEMIAVLQRRG